MVAGLKEQRLKHLDFCQGRIIEKKRANTPNMEAAEMD